MDLKTCVVYQTTLDMLELKNDIGTYYVLS